jgi:hypothetical protein
MSLYVSDFITPLQPEHYMRVQGIVEKVGGLQTGAIQLKIKDNEGKVHTVTLPGSVHIPGSTSRLLSLQHCVQVICDTKGTGCDTNGDEITLYWKQKK